MQGGAGALIAHIRGRLEHVLERSIVVDAGGVGYAVNVSPATLSRLPGLGEEVKVFTHMQVSENSQSLYGFLTHEEVSLFALLISVSGIGPRVATGILGALTPSQVMAAILADDSAALSRAPGVGRKTAQRLALELRDKIRGDGASPRPAAGGGAKQDALDALLALGYGRAEAMQSILEVADDEMAADGVIRLALRKLAGK